MKQILCDQCNTVIAESGPDAGAPKPTNCFSISEEIVGFDPTAEETEVPDLLIPNRGDFCSPQCVRDWLDIHFPAPKH